LFDSTHDAEGVVRARNLLSLMGKTLRSIMVYPERNPIIREQKERLDREFQAYLDEYGILTIRIDESAITLDGEVIYEGKGKGRGLVFLLYRDGVREISFHEGLGTDELNGFLEALAENWQVTEDTDVVSSFWEKDFRHITFIAINELFTDLAEPFENQGALSQQLQDLTSSGLSERIFLKDEDGEETSGLPQWVEEVVDKPQEVGSFILLDDEDLEEIRGLLEEDRKSFNPKREFIYVLFDLLLLENEQGEYATLLKTLTEYLSNLVSNGDFRVAHDVFSALHQVENNPDIQPLKVKNLVKRIREVVQRPELIEKIRKMIQDDFIVSWEDLIEYLPFMEEKAVPVLLDVLMRKKAQSVHPRAKDLLLKFGEENIEILGACLSDGRSELLNQIIPILSRVKEKAIPYLKIGLNHPDVEVRRKTVKALSRIGGEEVNSILSGLLRDQDQAVRILTAKCIDQPDEKTVDIVCGLIQQKEFMKKDVLERKALVGILQKADSEKAVATLRGLLYQKSWFKRSEVNRFRSYVAHVLAEMGTDSAIKVLEEGSQGKDKVVRNACRNALHRVGNRVREGGAENI